MKGKKVIVKICAALFVGLALWGIALLWKNYLEADHAIDQLDAVLEEHANLGWEIFRGRGTLRPGSIDLSSRPIFPWQLRELEEKFKRIFNYREQYRKHQREEYKWAAEVVQKSLSDIKAIPYEPEIKTRTRLIQSGNLLELRGLLKYDMGKSENLQSELKREENPAKSTELRKANSRIYSWLKPIAKLYESAGDYQLALAFALRADAISRPWSNDHRSSFLQKEIRLSTLRDKADRPFPEFVP